MPGHAPGRLAAVFALSLAPSLASAQQAPPAPPEALPEVVVTATRTPQPLSTVGSAISVITSEDIERSPQSPNRSVDDLLRQVPGLQLVQSGGPGRVQQVRIRGADVRHTLVLVDGIRVNDPSSVGRDFDFSNFVFTEIDRIEVLRGPQSALYGSDAMGGVINIITKKGDGPTRVTISEEAGSYGTSETRGSIKGGDSRGDYALGFDVLRTDGFSAFGYRIPRLRYLAPNGFERDSDLRHGVSGRFGLNVADGVRVEFGASTSWNRYAYDAAFLPFPDTSSTGETRLSNVYARLLVDPFGGVLKNSLTVFANRTERYLRSVTLGPFGSTGASTFIGDRVGVEYQGDLSLGVFGLTTFGGRVEREQADSFAEGIFPATPYRRTAAAEQTTRSVFVQHQLTIGDRLTITPGVRYDEVVSPSYYTTGVRGGEWAVDDFTTARLALAYDVPELGTKLRGSVGSGAKAPSLFQLFDPSFGTPNLASEHSVGVDAGIDQRLFDDRVQLSATVFNNRFRNLIDFSTGSGLCRPGQFFGCYFNVASAFSQGIELEGRIVLVPGWVTMRGAYTHLEARDEATNLKLARRPVEQGRIGFVITPFPRLSIEPAIVMVGRRFSSNNQTDPLAPYARLDLFADYRIDDTYSVFLRAENLTDTRYEEVKNYGTAGQSVYGGVRATW